MYNEERGRKMARIYSGNGGEREKVLQEKKSLKVTRALHKTNTVARYSKVGLCHSQAACKVGLGHV